MRRIRPEFQYQLRRFTPDFDYSQANAPSRRCTKARLSNLVGVMSGYRRSVDRDDDIPNLDSRLRSRRSLLHPAHHENAPLVGLVIAVQLRDIEPYRSCFFDRKYFVRYEEHNSKQSQSCKKRPFHSLLHFATSELCFKAEHRSTRHSRFMKHLSFCRHRWRFLDQSRCPGLVYSVRKRTRQDRNVISCFDRVRSRWAEQLCGDVRTHCERCAIVPASRLRPWLPSRSLFEPTGDLQLNKCNSVEIASSRPPEKPVGALFGFSGRTG
jgi:hypothetical protein